ncbi:uncharacterized protein LOC114013316 [Falco peregrinus]|uniref:uncharacterized protein LOC114013316 n=1 Tax=Falco peregrinus TaxID=8954 RepID=UPI002478F30F|nr:uncharacterized protein LOC114013316 [Falco peregrinus]
MSLTSLQRSDAGSGVSSPREVTLRGITAQGVDHDHAAHCHTGELSGLYAGYSQLPRVNAAFNERHRRCDASECLCPGGRELAEEEGPWQLLLCCSCAAEGTHRCCSFVKHTTTSRECKSCAGLGAAKRQSNQAAPGWGQQPAKAWVPRVGLAESLFSRRPGGIALACPAWHWGALPLTFLLPITACSASSDLAGPSTASQAELGPSHGSSTPEASSSSSASQLPSGPSSSSAQLKSDSRSGHAGPMRTRHRSRLQHRAPKPYSRPRKHQESSHVTAPCAESSTPSQAVLDPSHDCPALGTSSPSTASQAGSGPSHGSPAALTVQRHGRVLPGSVSPGEGHPQPQSRGPCPWPREAGPARLCPSARAPRRGPPGPQRVSRQRGLRRALAWPSRRSVARRRRRRGWAGGECAAVGPGPPRGPRL